MSNEVGAELLRRSAIDQEMRNKVIETNDMSLWNKTIDEDNTAFLEECINQTGWPIISEVGEEASQAAWLLVRHADHMPEFQARCLDMLKALPEGEVRHSNVAYLEDRVRVAQGRPQLYGTQFYKEGDAFGPRPIEDEAHLEERRAAMGLGTFGAYRQRLLEQYSNQG